MTRLLVALVAFGLGTLALTAAEPAPPGKIPKDTCVKPCWDCQAACLECMKHARDNKDEAMAKQCEICHHACLQCFHAVSSKNARAWEICELCGEGVYRLRRGVREGRRRPREEVRVSVSRLRSRLRCGPQVAILASRERERPEEPQAHRFGAAVYPVAHAPGARLTLPGSPVITSTRPAPRPG